MSTSQAPQRLHFGWVVVLAFGMMLAGLQASFYHVGASSEAGTMAWGMTAIVGLLLSPPLVVWLVVIWGIWKMKRNLRGRTVLALLPSTLLVAVTVVPLAWQPSRELRLRERFRATFDTDLPADARNVDATYPRLADSGRVDFVFQCSRESTEALVNAMNMEPQKGVPAHYSRLAHDWAIQNWKDARWYLCSGKRGAGCLLITDVRKERVLVTRNPLLDWTEDEVNGVK